VRLSDTANTDFAQILAWTENQFGAAQAGAYEEIVRAAIRELAHGPNIRGVRARNEVAPGFMTLHLARHGRRARHFLLFRVAHQQQRIEIARILHDSMDLKRHLPPSEE
jgi:toxin ParE1/3/4